ncbi:MAG: SlyX family protein [Neisseriaceae bacterium]|nr:SlyX family protein [Neisseriaceae bacterium]MBQ1837173.1 SlyX family protein [Neisseriaceae bacterium]MBQ5429485.1 SlyX family protein [Neisseriaceae bacterium]
MNNDEYNQRLIALEERLAWQDETIDSLDKTVTRLNETVRLQQEQLSWLYRRLENTSNTEMPANEKPPHY